MGPTKHPSAWRLNKAEEKSVDSDLAVWEASLPVGLSQEETLLKRKEERKRLVRVIQELSTTPVCRSSRMLEQRSRQKQVRSLQQPAKVRPQLLPRLLPPPRPRTLSTTSASSKTWL